MPTFESRPTTLTAGAYGRRAARWSDLAIVLGASAVGAIAASFLPAGNFLRLLLTLPALLLAPGYLLIQALVARSRGGIPRASDALWALGVSPAVVGLLALSTAFLPGGFRASSIVAAVTVAAIGFAAVAFGRRRAYAVAHGGSTAAPVTSTPTRV